MKASSQSAPLFAEKKFAPAERVKQMRQLSSRKFNSYVLPTPAESRSPVSTKEDPPQVLKTKRPNLSTSAINFRHSSPPEQGNYGKNVEKEKISEPKRLSPPSAALRENNSNISSRSDLLPPPLAERFSPQRSISDAKSFKRQAFSGPLTGKSIILSSSVLYCLH